MAGVVFQDGTVLTANELNAAMQQKADVQNPNFTGIFAVPSGPASARPVTPAQFAFRGNSDTGLPEVFIGGAWVAIGLNSPGNAPSPPTSLIVGQVTSSAIPVSWAASTGSGTISYQVQYQISGSSAWTNWGGPNSALSATITGLQAATKYNVQVIASNQFGNTISATVSATTQGIAPNAPTGLTLTEATSNSFELTWNGSTIGSPPISYQAAFKTVSGSAYTNFGTAISGTTEAITGLQPATAYTMHVTAIGSGGTAISVDVSGTTLSAAGVAPNAPTALTTSSLANNSLVLSWTASSAGSTPINYTVFASKHNLNAWVQIGAAGTSVSRTIPGLNPNTSYDFYVQASNSAGTAQSSVVSATTTAVTPGTTGQVWGTQFSSLSVPVLQGPVAGQSATGTILPITGLSVNDPPAVNNPGNCSLTISCNQSAGKVSSTDANGNPISGSGTGSINGYLGSMSSIGTALQNLKYTAPSSAMTDSISITFTDQSNNTAQIAITMTVVAGSGPALPWGNSSLPGPGSIATDGSGTTALRVQDILGNFGVNTQIDLNGSPYFNNLPAIENAINYLGVTMLRDSPDPSQSSDTTWYPQIKNNVSVIGGLNYWLYIQEGDSTNFQPQLNVFSQMASFGYVLTFEGEQAADFGPQGVAAAEAFQPTLFHAAHAASGVAAATFSVSASFDYTTIPSQAAVSDIGTVGFTPVDAPFDSGFQQYYTAATSITPGKPAILNNFGWQSFPEGGSATGQQNNASVNAVAAYLLDTIFDATMLGFTKFFWANMVDNPVDFGGATTFGLFDSSWNPKPAGSAVRNMNLLMMDQGATARTFTPGKLSFGLSVPAVGIDVLGMHSMVLQRSDGAFFLVLWNEQVLQDLSNYPNQTNAEITVAPVSNTVTLSTSATHIAVYDPMIGVNAVQTGSGTSITVSVPAHPIFVEIVRP